jgi:hypothetical protein
LLNIESFRVYCKQEVLKEFDGDYNFLLSKIVKDYKNSQNNFTLYSTQSVKTDYVDTSIWPQELMDVLDQTYQDYPLTQIAIQVDPGAWDPYSYIPNVVYLNSQYDEADTDFISGYDEFGNAISLDARTEPTLPIVILSTNERGYINGSGDYVKDNLLPSYEIDNSSIVSNTPLLPINPNLPQQYYRTDFRYENIYQMRYDNIGQVEGWPAGAPETVVFVFEQDPLDSTKNIKRKLGTIEPPKRKDIKNTWFGTDIDSHLWRYYKTGTDITYGFYEEDNKGISEIGNTLITIGNYSSFILDSTKVHLPGQTNPNLPSPQQPGWLTILKYTANVVGQFFNKNIEKSEEIGSIVISVNNPRKEYSLIPGGFKFASRADQ